MVIEHFQFNLHGVHAVPSAKGASFDFLAKERAIERSTVGETHPEGPSRLEEWAAKRKIEKHIGTGPLAYSVRAIGWVVASVIAILSAAFIVIYNLSVKIDEKRQISREPQSPVAAIRAMKQKEETDKFLTMKNVVEGLKLGALSPQEGAASLTKDLATFFKIRRKDARGEPATANQIYFARYKPSGNSQSRLAGYFSRS